MPKVKVEKYDWFCRHCSKLQNRRAAADPHPLCKSCGREMETNDVIADEPIAGPAKRAKRATPAEVSTPESAPAPTAAGSPAIIAAMVDQRRRIEDAEKRLAAIEQRMKTPSAVFEDLSKALMLMSREELTRLADTLDAHAQHILRARAAVGELIAN